MWDEVLKDAEEPMSSMESLDALADLSNIPLVERFGPSSVLQAEILSLRFRSSLETLQDGIAEQIAQLQEAFAEIADAAAPDAMDQIGALGFLPQIQEAANTGLSDYLAPLKSGVAGDLEVVSARELAKLQLTDICETAVFAQDSVFADIQAMLDELALDVPLSNNGILGTTGLDELTSISGISSALPDTGFKASYLDDLQESIRDLYAELAEHLDRVPSAVLPKSIQIPSWRQYTSALGVAPNVDLEKLGARHGTQFTVRQAFNLRGRCPDGGTSAVNEEPTEDREQARIHPLGASFGSKLLRLYVGLLFILWYLLANDLLTTQKLRNKRLCHFIKCLSPPPVQPLSRLPTVKPNAPNVAA